MIWLLLFLIAITFNVRTFEVFTQATLNTKRTIQVMLYPHILKLAFLEDFTTFSVYPFFDPLDSVHWFRVPG